MSYLVLARKYRPQSFETIVAQEHITRTLRHALMNDRVSSGYLFCGPRGTGKTTIARILAMAVNCADSPTATPCGTCPSCTEIASGSSLDVLEIDAASNTGVDDMRTLRENVRYLPTRGKRRIYIIDEVHRLSDSAFDALLKTLEEPPEHVIFILATTEPLKVPDTVLSRTQRFDFRRVSPPDLLEHMRTIAEREQIEADIAALRLLARKADGSVRDALSLLDQIAAFAGDKITEKDVINALGLVDRQFLFDFVEAVAAADRLKALQLVKSLFDSGSEVKDFVLELLDHLRCLMILRSAPEATDLLELNEQEIGEYGKQAEYFTVGDYLRLMRMLSDLHRDLKSGLNERLLLETTAVMMAEMESTVRFEDILAHMEGKTTPEVSPSETAPQKTQSDIFNSKKAAPAQRAESPPVPEGHAGGKRILNMPQVATGWDAFLTLLKKSSPMLASQIRMAELRSIKDNQLLMFFAASGDTSLQLVTKTDNMNVILKTLREHFGANLSVKFDIDPQKNDTNTEKSKSEQPKVDPKELVKRSPRLKSLLEKVDGEIIGIKKADD